MMKKVVLVLGIAMLLGNAGCHMTGGNTGDAYRGGAYGPSEFERGTYQGYPEYGGAEFRNHAGE